MLRRDCARGFSEGMEEAKPKYYIDLKWYDEHGRSFRTVTQARLCDSCKDKIGTETQERVPSIDRKTGRVVFELKSVPYADNPMSVIRSCCSKRRDYITPETPVLEAIFRILLATSNQPMDVERLREELGNFVAMSERPHAYSPELMERLIRSDRNYGLREFDLAAE